MAKTAKEIRIQNRKARFEYEIIERFVAGIKLVGTEIKALREGKASIAESYAYMEAGELYVRNMNIQEYSHGNINNHDPVRNRKLLLTKKELKKISVKLKDTGTTLVPLLFFINERGIAKLEIGLAKGKKLYDKRHSLKEKSLKRDIDRASRH
jgi:SsrA-binding protein